MPRRRAIEVCEEMAASLDTAIVLVDDQSAVVARFGDRLVACRRNRGAA